MSETATGILDRALRQFQRAWRFAAGGPSELKYALDPHLPEGDLDRIRQHIDACLEGRGGEVSARARAAELGEAYLSLDSEGRRRFLELLAREYDVDNATIDAAIAARQSAADTASRRAAETRLREALVAPRVRLLSRFNDLNQGVKFLVDMRAELLVLLADDPSLKPLDADIHTLLSHWFDVGFLDLKHITWETPASILEKLIAYEAVHEIASWEDLKKRLEQDRRCYAYFHPGMPDEPLIFVEVALVNGMADSIQNLLDRTTPGLEPERADTAIFYSISNCQRGLAGVRFGNFLIKRVVDDLRRELPNLKSFATLSPLPGFMRWLERLDGQTAAGLLDEDETANLAGICESEDPFRGLSALLKTQDWWQDDALTRTLEPLLSRLCAHYLLNGDLISAPRDRVAHFHLSNGARIERINWLADLSPRGLMQSAGMMVNYLYSLKDIERNHERYTGDGHVNAAPAVLKLMRG